MDAKTEAVRLQEAEAKAREYLDQLSQLSDKYLALEEELDGLVKQQAKPSQDVAVIEGLYKQKIKEQKTELKKTQKYYKGKLIKKGQQLNDQKNVVVQKEQEIERLQEKCLTLQEEVEQLKAQFIKITTEESSFDSEGHFRTLYQESNKALEKAHQKIVDLMGSHQTKLQLAKEKCEDQKDDLAELQAEIKALKFRENELDKIYRAQLDRERVKNLQLEEELSLLREQYGLGGPK